MNEEQRSYFHDLIMSNAAMTNEFVQYWKQYSSITTWQFWATSIIIVGLLIALYFLIDRHNIFLVGFFGFANHMIFVYTDTIIQRLGLLGYPYHIVPYIPNFAISAAIVPISIMLVFQWTYRNNKNYYFYALITALFLGFIFKPIITNLGFFVMYGPTNYVILTFFYMLTFLLSYWLTKGFLWMQEKTEVNTMPRRGRDAGRETTPHPDGLKEGVMNDPTGVQYGVEVGQEKVINPADIAKMTSETSDRKKKQ